MAIPSILLAIAVVSLSGASLMTVLIAITIPEIPRVARLVRSVVLSAREEPYVEAAISVGSSLPKIMWRHLMPNTIAPLIVQGTYVCASAILTEAILSFLGAGINPETPTWGNIMAEGRAYLPDQAVADLLAGSGAVDRDPEHQPDRRRRPRRARSPPEAAGGRQVNSPCRHCERDSIPGLIPGMNALAFTREERRLRRVSKDGCFGIMVRDARQEARPSP